MEPRSPSVLDEPEPEEPIEVMDYYQAVRMGWLSSGVVEGVVEEVEPDSTPPRTTWGVSPGWPMHSLCFTGSTSSALSGRSNGALCPAILA